VIHFSIYIYLIKKILSKLEGKVRKTKKKNNDKSLTKIIKTAISLFSKKWYSTVSIAEICRNSEISNGLFYHYFQNKEELIKSILDKTVNEIDTLLSSIKGESLKQKINNLICSLHSYTKKNKELILVFREGQ